MAMKQRERSNSVNPNRSADFLYLVRNAVDDRSYPRNPGFQVVRPIRIHITNKVFYASFGRNL